MSHFYQDIHLARIEALLQRLKHEVLLDERQLTLTVMTTREPVPYSERATAATTRPIQEGEHWGGAWECGWFHITGQVPPEWRGRVALHFNFGGEACVFDADGCPAYGLTNGSVFDHAFNKDIFPFLDNAAGGEPIDLWVDAGANGLFGVDRCVDPDWIDDQTALHGTFDGTLRRARVCRFDYDAWQLWLDFGVLVNLIKALQPGTARRMGLLRTASRAAGIYATQGAAAARRAIANAWAVGPDPAAPDVYGVGHAHIDVGWLWPLRETVRKCERTFSSQLALIDKYPDYVFGASQAQLYEWMEQRHPDLFKKIQRQVAAGRWEIQGGMWVEADCNLPDGESLIRQLLVGKNYFRDKFGVVVRNLWLPDVFGYSGNLPQILKRSGIDYFLTQKLSWNRYNKFPHNTFWWRGIDGSTVLAHFPPEDAYDSDLTPALLRRHETNNAEAGLVQEAICLYGIGDGGGGPSENHVERGLRCRALNGCPKFHFGFAQPVLEKMAAYGDELDTWTGELYFEMHRGTLTSQAGIKRANRRCEEAFHTAETLAALAAFNTGADYPSEKMLELWKRFLTNQFHDILPGSCIHRVYAEQVPEIERIIAELNAMQESAAAKLLTPEPGATTWFNPSPTPYYGLVTMADGTRRTLHVPAMSFATLRQNPLPPIEESPIDGNDIVLDNRFVRYTLNPGDMTLRSCVDLQSGREFIRPDEPANVLRILHDIPPRWDAWDIEEYTEEMCLGTAKTEQVTRFDGAAGCGAKAIMTIGSTRLNLTARLLPDSPRLDFEISLDWQERHKLLRVFFPVAVESTVAKFEIQYGTVSRPTTDNTKWEHAQFECVGHRFADLSETNFGVALLNDCKYGYRVKGHELSLSLLRAPTEPDPVADIGEQRFRYAFLPHQGELADSKVWDEANALNQGVARFENMAATNPVALPIQVEGVELTILKKAEKDNCLVARLVERRGVRTLAKLHVAENVKLAETDLMEWENLGEIDADKPLEFAPFAIRTIKLYF